MSFNRLLSCPFEDFADESKRIGLFHVICAKDKLQMHKSDKIIDNIFFFIFLRYCKIPNSTEWEQISTFLFTNCEIVAISDIKHFGKKKSEAHLLFL